MARQKRNDATVKIDSSLARKAKMIAAYRDVTIAEYLSALLDGPIARDYKKMKKEMGAEQDPDAAADEE